MLRDTRKAADQVYGWPLLSLKGAVGTSLNLIDLAPGPPRADTCLEVLQRPRTSLGITISSVDSDFPSMSHICDGGNLV